jgi:drug/metabolite transporter (DMT)-like permease
MKNKEMMGLSLAVLAAIVSGISIPANKIFVINLDPAVFTAIRAVIIGIIFLALSLAIRKKKKDNGPSKKSWKYLLSIAIVGGSFAFLLFFTGLKLTTSAHAAFLQKTLPLFVAVMAFVFLKEKLTKKYAAAMLVMLVGMIIIFFDQINPSAFWQDPKLGDALVLAATILWAAENVISKKAMISGVSNFIVSFSRMFFGGLILFGVVILTGKAGILFSLTQVQIINIGISTMLLFLYVLFYYWSMKYINVSKTAVLLLIAPIISTAFGIMLLQEPLTVAEVAGASVILIGAYMICGIKSEERGI